MVALQRDNALNRKPEYVMFALIFITVDLRTVFGFYYYRIMPLATASVSKLEAFPPVLVVNRFALQFYPYTNASLYPRFHNITNFVISFRTTSICLILSYLLTKTC